MWQEIEHMMLCKAMPEAIALLCVPPDLSPSFQIFISSGYSFTQNEHHIAVLPLPIISVPPVHSLRLPVLPAHRFRALIAEGRAACQVSVGGNIGSTTSCTPHVAPPAAAPPTASPPPPAAASSSNVSESPPLARFAQGEFGQGRVLP